MMAVGATAPSFHRAMPCFTRRRRCAAWNSASIFSSRACCSASCVMTIRDRSGHPPAALFGTAHRTATPPRRIRPRNDAPAPEERQTLIAGESAASRSSAPLWRLRPAVKVLMPRRTSVSRDPNMATIQTFTPGSVSSTHGRQRPRHEIITTRARLILGNQRRESW